MLVYAPLNSSIDLLIVTMEMIGYPYLGYVVLAVLYFSFAIFSLFSAGICYYIKRYSLGFSLATIPYLTLLGSGFLAIFCYETKEYHSICREFNIITIYIISAIATAFGKSILWIMACGFATEVSPYG